jgi:hypothetical protein
MCCGQWITLRKDGAGFDHDFDCRAFMSDSDPAWAAVRRSVCQQLFDADRLCPEIAPFCEPFMEEMQRERSRKRDEAERNASELPADLSNLDDETPTIEFAPMLVPPLRVSAVDEAAHRFYEQRVITYINDVLQTYSNRANTVAENLNNAQSFVTDERRSNSSDTLLRDAEVYLKARAMIAARRHKPTRVVCKYGGVTLSLIYNGLKFVTSPLGGVMEADEGNPNSPPGGDEWVLHGANDGYTDPVDTMGPATPVSIRE